MDRVRNHAKSIVTAQSRPLAQSSLCRTVPRSLRETVPFMEEWLSKSEREFVWHRGGQTNTGHTPHARGT